MTLLEILSLRYGQESWREIFCVYPFFHKNIINRMGIGFNLPIKMLFKTENNINLLFDIVFSDWKNIDQKGLEKSFFTIQLAYDLIK